MRLSTEVVLSLLILMTALPTTPAPPLGRSELGLKENVNVARRGAADGGLAALGGDASLRASSEELGLLRGLAGRSQLGSTAGRGAAASAGLPGREMVLTDSSSGGGGGEKNETAVDKQKKEEEKEEKTDDSEKVSLGIDIASVQERQQGILHCKSDEVEDGAQAASSSDATRVKVGIYMLNLGAGDGGLERGTFFADFLLYLRDDADGKGLNAWEGQDPLKQLSFSNSKGFPQTRTYGSGIHRVSGDFFFSPDLRWFPFDTQNLPVVVEQTKDPLSEWVFVSSHATSGMSPSIRFPGWQGSLRNPYNTSQANCKTRLGFKVYPGEPLIGDMGSSYSNVTYSRFSYTVSVQRAIWQGVLMRFLPPAVMLLPTMFVYLLEPLKNTAAKVSVCSGSLVTVILFHSGVVSQLPPLGYLSFFDKYVFCFYLTVFVALVCIASSLLIFREQEDSTHDYNQDIISSLRFKQRFVAAALTALTYLAFLPVWSLYTASQVLPVAIYGLVVIAFVIWLVYSTYNLRGGGHRDMGYIEVGGGGSVEGAQGGGGLLLGRQGRAEATDYLSIPDPLNPKP